MSADRRRAPVAGAAGWSLARQLFVLQVLIVLGVVLAGAGLAWYEANRQTHEAAREQVVAVARTLAADPTVRTAVRTEDPSAVLQPLAERVRRDTGVAFITIMDVRGIRYTHPDPGRIGERFLGHFGPAPRGATFVETYAGTLGPSVRTVVPVFDETRNVRALVSVGITVKALTAELRAQVIWLVAAAVAALALGAAATALVNRRLRRHTYGLSPAELARLYEYHDAILHAVREGLLLVDPAGRLTLCNDGAAELLSVDAAEVEGADVAALGVPETLRETLVRGETVRDEVHLTDDRVLLVSVSPVSSDDRSLGSVVTLRDHTELQVLSGELDSVRGFSESLRAQAHESANRLHTVVSLIELGRTEEAVQFATAELELAQQLTDRVVAAVGEPVLAALLLGKIAEAWERGVEVQLTEDTNVDASLVDHVAARDLVTVLGNLVDNAVEATLERDETPRVLVTVLTGREELLIRVADNGPGVDPVRVRSIFERGWSTKQDGRGLGLALVGQSVRRYGGVVEVTEGGSPEGDSTERGGAVFTVRIPFEVNA